MIADLIDKLIDRLIQLAKYQKEIKRSFFEEFVMPSYSLFEEIHSEYLKCFNNYRAIIESTDDFDAVVDHLCDTIMKDNLFSEHQRGKLVAWLHTEWPSGTEFKEFVTLIRVYLFENLDQIHGTEATELGIDQLGPQHWRNSLQQKLKEISKETDPECDRGSDKKETALVELDGIVSKMQYSSFMISKQYMALKSECMK